ncbi:MAG: endonuclease [Bacteriovoracaceae bacterium]|nr:endonuclease [Bacteriovoracaceae bacterium]
MIKYFAFVVVVLTLFSTQLYADSDCNRRWADAVESGLITEDYQGLVGACDKKLLTKIYSFAKKGHYSLSYTNARIFLFGTLDNHAGKVCSIYDIDKCVRTKKIPNANIINCEHAWPKSLGASSSPAKSDLHHLYPSSNTTNSRRSNFPFCEVTTIHWENGISALGSNSNNRKCFEPPVEYRGNIARSLFYFAARYKKQIRTDEEFFLRKWHIEDPVDLAELNRHNKIVEKQKNVNPFILQPYLVDLITDF